MGKTIIPSKWMILLDDLENMKTQRGMIAKSKAQSFMMDLTASPPKHQFRFQDVPFIFSKTEGFLKFLVGTRMVMTNVGYTLSSLRRKLYDEIIRSK